MLSAAFAFARSSERLHQWLLNHRVFGPLIHNWREHGAISKRTKAASVASMAAILGISLIMKLSLLVIAIQAVVLGACACFIVSRPLPPN